MKTVILFLAILGLVFADELSDCKCGPGYHAVKESNGQVRCYGIYLKAIMGCNIPTSPRCVCTGDVTGIINDAQGIFCGQYKNGVEQKRWDCENKEEWNKFYAENPNEKANLH